MEDNVMLELEKKRAENFKYFSDSFRKQLLVRNKKVHKSQSLETINDRIKEEVLRKARLKNDGWSKMFL